MTESRTNRTSSGWASSALLLGAVISACSSPSIHFSEVIRFQVGEPSTGPSAAESVSVLVHASAVESKDESCQLRVRSFSDPEHEQPIEALLQVRATFFMDANGNGLREESEVVFGSAFGSSKAPTHSFMLGSYRASASPEREPLEGTPSVLIEVTTTRGEHSLVVPSSDRT